MQMNVTINIKTQLAFYGDKKESERETFFSYKQCFTVSKSERQRRWDARGQCSSLWCSSCFSRSMTVKQLEDVVVVDREVKLDQSQSRKTAEAVAVAAAVAALVPNPKSRSILQSKQPQFALLLSRDKQNLVRAQTHSLKFLWVT